MPFALSKDWTYMLQATPEACEAAFRNAFSEQSFGRGKWSITREAANEEPGQPAQLVVAELVGTNFLRGMTRQGNTLGSTVVFGVFEANADTGTTRCAMSLIDSPRYKTPKMIASARANGDMIKGRMKRVTRCLRELDPNLEFVKSR